MVGMEKDSCVPAWRTSDGAQPTNVSLSSFVPFIPLATAGSDDGRMVYILKLGDRFFGGGVVVNERSGLAGIGGTPLFARLLATTKHRQNSTT